jgi:hypothetical protein
MKRMLDDSGSFGPNAVVILLDAYDWAGRRTKVESGGRRYVRWFYLYRAAVICDGDHCDKYNIPIHQKLYRRISPQEKPISKLLGATRSNSSRVASRGRLFLIHLSSIRKDFAMLINAYRHNSVFSSRVKIVAGKTATTTLKAKE